MLLFFWLIIYMWRKDLRKEMLWGGVLGLPFGLSNFLWVPEYWDPPVLFNLVHRIGFSIEDLLFAFIAASTAAVAYEIVTRRTVYKIKSDKRNHYAPYILVIVSFLLLELISPTTTVYNMTITIAIGAVAMGIKRPKLIPQMLIGSVTFNTFYIVLFAIWAKIPAYQNYFDTIYNAENLIGIRVLGIPIEEVMFGFAVGAAWSVFYEFIRGYRTRKIAAN